MSVFFFNDTATTEIYTLALHDALPIYDGEEERGQRADEAEDAGGQRERRHARVRRREVGCRAAPVARSGHDCRLGPRLLRWRPARALRAPPGGRRQRQTGGRTADERAPRTAPRGRRPRAAARGRRPRREDGARVRPDTRRVAALNAGTACRGTTARQAAGWGSPAEERRQEACSRA